METSGTNALKANERFTVRQWRSWPEDERWELIGGSAFNMSPAPRLPHQRLSGKLYGQMLNWFRGKPCEPFYSPVDVYLPDSPDQDDDDIDTVVQPDLMVVCDPAKCRDEGIRGAPDFVIEILSPGTAWRDQTDKRRLYERAGVREYWIIHPDSLDVIIYRLAAGRFEDPCGANLRQPVACAIFPGLSLAAEP
jgi:Uma2 family endonuclease